MPCADPVRYAAKGKGGLHRKDDADVKSAGVVMRSRIGWEEGSQNGHEDENLPGGYVHS
jgi:hypothetical protein